MADAKPSCHETPNVSRWLRQGVVITRNGKHLPACRTSGRSVSVDGGDACDTPELNTEIADDFSAGGGFDRPWHDLPQAH
jgi:hypothetical protein